MRAGQLRHRISIQAPQEIQEDTGAITTEWIELCETWGFVQPGTGTERWADNLDVRVVQRPVRIRMRYRDDVTITEKCRIVWDRHTYDVIAIADQAGIHRELFIFGNEIDPEEQ